MEPMEETPERLSLAVRRRLRAARRSTLGLANEHPLVGCLSGRSSLVNYASMLNIAKKRLDDDMAKFRKRRKARYVIPEPTKLGFSVTTSPKGGIDIKIGSDNTIHVWKYMSAHHPLVHMLLLADHLSSNKFQIAKYMVPQTIIDMVKDSQTIIDMVKDSSSSTSRKMYQAGFLPKRMYEVGWSPEKCPSQNTMVGNNGKSSEASLPVLRPYFSDRNTTVSTVDKGSMISEVGCDMTVLAIEESLHEQNSMDNSGGSSGNTSILGSVPNVLEHIVTEPKNHSNPDSVAADHHDIEEECKSMDTWLVASAATHHATGNRGLLSDFKPEHGLYVEAGDGEPMEVCGRGSVITDTVVIPDVCFVPGLTNNLVSASQLTELEYCLGFARGSCIISRMTDSMIVGKASLGEDGLFQLEYLKLPVIFEG